MKVLSALVISLVVAMLATGVTLAQQPSHEHRGAPQQPPASGPAPATPPHGDQAHQMQHMQQMEMCRQMMMGQPGMMGGGMMGGGMMGMPMMMGGDPKQQAEMMAMRGEMMKAMGDIMMKYAQRMQSAK